MTEATNTTANESGKIKTVLADLPSRSLFDSVTDAEAFFAKCAADLSDFSDYPVVFAGSDSEGNFDPAVYTDSMQVAVVKLTEKGNREAGKESTVKAIVIYPSPKLEAVVADSAMSDWLATIVAKEANLVAMRPLRKAVTAGDLADAQQAMPLSFEDYRTSGRETTSGILETFNTLWQLIKKAMGEKFKSFGIANLSKKELRKAMESASYAATVYPKLETRENKSGEPDSYFVKAIKLGQALAAAESLDPTIFDNMLATRNEKAIEVADDEDEDEVDFEAMAAKIAAAAKSDESSENEAPATTEA